MVQEHPLVNYYSTLWHLAGQETAPCSPTSLVAWQYHIHT